jgi:hypothetical protein
VERSHCVDVEIDGVVDLAGIEEAALDFARRAPAELVASAVEALGAELVDVVVGRRGEPVRLRDQPEAPWSCTKCASSHGFRRRGCRPGGRKLNSAVGQVHFGLAQLECLRCKRRFAPMLQVLGLVAHQRRTERLGDMAVALAVEVAYAKAARLLSDLGGVSLSARSIRRQVLTIAPERLGPEILDVPIVLLDGTGVRAGNAKLGVGLHLAIGLVARRHEGGRVAVEARLLGATLGEGWPVMAELLAPVRPGLVIVDGEEELSIMAGEVWPGVPVQRCLFHLSNAVQRVSRYTDGIPLAAAKTLRARFDAMLTAAYRSGDADAAATAYDDLVATLDHADAPAAAEHLRVARPEALTFLTHPDAGRLLFGDKGRPELGTGVLERVMREMNRRTDVGVRWSIHGARAILMVKLGRKYHHGQWAPKPEPTIPPAVRFTLVA